MIPLLWYGVLSGALFGIGIAGALMRRNIILVLLSIQLMLIAGIINLVAFSQYLHVLTGQAFALLIILAAASEMLVVLGFVIVIVRNWGTMFLDEINTLKE